MRLGRLNKRITIRRASAPTRNAMNEPVEAWADFGKFWAEQISQLPTESWKAGQTAAQVERVWRVRWHARTATISPSDRLVCDGREFQIIGVTEIVRCVRIEIVGIAYSEEGLNT
ncbi:MAG: head-tail adaptor protein [Sphingomonas sp.]|jgi:head-tail adaptor